MSLPDETALSEVECRAGWFVAFTPTVEMDKSDDNHDVWCLGSWEKETKSGPMGNGGWPSLPSFYGQMCSQKNGQNVPQQDIGTGFIFCPELHKENLEKTNSDELMMVYVHGKVVLRSCPEGLEKGDRQYITEGSFVSFELHYNQKGLPQASGPLWKLLLPGESHGIQNRVEEADPENKRFSSRPKPRPSDGTERSVVKARLQQGDLIGPPPRRGETVVGGDSMDMMGDMAEGETIGAPGAVNTSFDKFGNKRPAPGMARRLNIELQESELSLDIDLKKVIIGTVSEDVTPDGDHTVVYTSENEMIFAPNEFLQERGLGANSTIAVNVYPNRDGFSLIDQSSPCWILARPPRKDPTSHFSWEIPSEFTEKHCYARVIRRCRNGNGFCKSAMTDKVYGKEVEIYSKF